MTEPFSPEWGNPSLRTIVEVEFPEPVSLMPSTPGWWILLFALIGLLLRLLWKWRLRYLRDRYRREALEQLTEIKERINAGAVEAVRDLAPLLRATAITAAGRDSISQLQGDDYAMALAELAPNQRNLPLADIQYLAYAPLEDTEILNIDELIMSIESWIQQHRRIYA